MSPAGDTRWAVAFQAAADTHDFLGTDQSERVDIYGAIDRLGLFLTFQPLANLLGVTLPEHAGVMITTERQPPVQRYTAAHELGHFVMHDRGLVLDGEDEIIGRSTLERERQAQLFASYFLMPPDLADNTASRYGIRRGKARPGDVYQAARDMGVSYEAAIWHYLHLGRLESTDAQRLLKAQRTAKRDAVFGLKPLSGRPDVWPIEGTTEEVKLEVTVGDEIVVRLPENRSTGYRWITLDENRRRVDYPSRPEPPPLTGSASAGESTPAPTPPLQQAAASGSSNIERLRPRATHGADQLDVITDVYQSPHHNRRPVTTRRERARGSASAEVAPGAMPLVGGVGGRLIGWIASLTGDAQCELVLARPRDASLEPLTRWRAAIHIQPAPREQRLLQLLATDLDRRTAGDPPDEAIFDVEPDE